ncbi:MAG: hypothetical protein GWM98_28620, partial [Nitrospinaceae bacterium]|nr:hypothetical protein [Nitrospinaceae bacterium]NIR57694.1 hypothetical protein [Nitrospinaceae bacterium]NIS88157.1 hypothetical protein [Nitrospinaceae bacterium]NIT85036.1 hypothetical protein [Nitrospinaceae bacterium]NIU47197.1 hypothetical protein [Nitrospinaceae bacterium]
MLKLSPEDKVQSKVFDPQAFRRARRIAVLGFENKTVPPFKDESAGRVVAEEITRELQSFRNYRVLPPSQTREDAQLKIVTTPSQAPEKKAVPQKEVEKETISGLPYSQKEMDAIMIGAVTKFQNQYRDRRGRIRESLSSGVEFTAFLVSTQTGEIIWGARFV